MKADNFWNDLTEILNENVPEVVASIKPALDRSDFERLSADAGVTLDSGIGEFYEVHNGMGEFFGNLRILTFEEALNARQELLEETVSMDNVYINTEFPFSPDWFPFVEDRMGNIIFFNHSHVEYPAGELDLSGEVHSDEFLEDGFLRLYRGLYFYDRDSASIIGNSYEDKNFLESLDDLMDQHVDFMDFE